MKSIEDVLDFQIIKKDVCRHAYFQATKNRILNLEYISSLNELNSELNLLEDAFAITKEFANPILDEVSILDEILDLLSKNYVLNKDEFYEIYKLLNASKNVAEFLRRNHIDGDNKVIDMMKQVDELESLNKSFAKIFDESFEVKDDASSALSRIKEEIQSEYSFLKKKLNELMSRHKDIIVGNLTIKNDRYVLPVNFANKYTISGIIVEQSASLKTCYVEPNEAIDINNRISKLKEKEEEEIARILKNLSSEVSLCLSSLISNYKLLQEIDFVFAKAIYAYQNNCSRPIVSENKSLSFIDLYHPFIPVEKVVKNSIYFDNNKNLLLISGPNAGGKTVLLKSIVLACYMTQLGMYVYAKEAHTYPFDKYYVDLGDNQSIINSLSTFSSHITNLKEITDNVTSDSFVVLDELGSSTDPRDGEALAIAIAEYLINRGCKCIITTHFNNLKNYAFDDDKCKIISMAFDTVNIAPTYKIIEDVAGSSFAYEIASIVGLKPEIIAKAKEYKKNNTTELEASLEEVNKLKAELYQEQEKMLKKTDELGVLIKNEEDKNKQLLEQINYNKSKANDIIEGYIAEGKEMINELLNQLQNSHKENELIKAKGDLDELLVKKEEKENKEVFNVGDQVYLINAGRIGKISSIKGNEFTIELGNIHMVVNKSEIESYKTQKVKKSPIKERKIAINNAKTELNIIGKRADEAREEILKFLSDAIGASLKTVRIIHGYGEGVLRKVTHEILKSSKYVKSFHFAGAYDGGMGATIVEL